jgi:hypothetical protein
LTGFLDAIDLQTNGGNTIAGNFIGTTADGTAGGATILNSSNNNGVKVESQHNTIGGIAPASRNLISGNGAGVWFPPSPVADNSNNLIEGNLIGLDVTGTTGIPNNYGVLIEAGAQETIGGTSPAAGNVVSGNSSDGIFIQLTGPDSPGGHVIEGNIIGLDGTGTALVLTKNPGGGPNYQGNLQQGVFIYFPSFGSLPNNPLSNTIGGPAPGAGNIISGNTQVGLSIAMGIDPGGNLIQGNDFGTDLSGTKSLGNVGGINLQGPNNTVGGIASGAGNVIAFNIRSSGVGVAIVSGSPNNVCRTFPIRLC